MRRYSRKRKYSRKKGGRFIGKGSYGCTFIPSLLCKDERTPREGVSKLLTNKDEAQIEIKISQKLLSIDPERKYFLTSTGDCVHDPSSLNMSEKNGKSCNKYQTGRNTRDRYLIFYPMGGQNIDSVILPSDKYSVFIKSLRNLFEGLVVLHRADIFHADIKEDNILSLYENGNYNTRFIDFGLTSVIRVNGLSTLNILANHEIMNYHPYYPLDVILMTESSRRRINQKFINDWNTKIKTSYLYVPQSVYWDRNWNLNINSDTIMQQYNDNYIFYGDIKRITKSIDIGALGIALYTLYSRLTGHYSRIDNSTSKNTIAINIPGYQGKIQLKDLRVEHFNGDREIYGWHLNIASNFSLKFFDLIIKMLDINGSLRLTAEEALEYFDSILIDIDTIFYGLFDESVLKKSLKYINVKVAEPEFAGFPRVAPPVSAAFVPLPPRRPTGPKPPPRTKAFAPPPPSREAFAPLLSRTELFAPPPSREAFAPLLSRTELFAPPPSREAFAPLLPTHPTTHKPPSRFNLAPPASYAPASHFPGSYPVTKEALYAPARHFPGSYPLKNLTGVPLLKTRKNNNNASLNNTIKTANLELERYKSGLGL